MTAGLLEGFSTVKPASSLGGAPQGLERLLSQDDCTHSVLPQQGLPGVVRRFVHLDDKGHASMTELDKHAMVRDLGIRYRDALMLDPAIPIPFPASLLVREKAIIVNLEAIRMIICANQCYVLSVPKDGDASAAVLPTVESRFVRHLSACLATMHQPTATATVTIPRAARHHSVRDGSVSGGGLSGHDFDPDAPYELRALEVGLAAVVREMDSEVWNLERDGYPASSTMAKAVSESSLEAVRTIKERLARLSGRVERLKVELEKLLSDDADMQDMYLGRRAQESGLPLLPQPRSLSVTANSSQSLADEQQRCGYSCDAAEPHAAAPSDASRAGMPRAEVQPLAPAPAAPPTQLAHAASGSGHGLSGMERLFARISGRSNGGIVIRRLRSLPRRQVSLTPASSTASALGSPPAAAAGPPLPPLPFNSQNAPPNAQHNQVPQPQEAEEQQEEELIIQNPVGGAFVDPRDIESAEDLLETAFIHVDYILRRLQLLADRITDDEMLVRIAMDGRRNELVGLNLLVTNVTMGLAFVSMVTGFFGQNLYNVVWLAQDEAGFWSILAAEVAGLIALPTAVLLYMWRRKLTFVSGLT